jgi:hypothetical protein
MILAERPPLRSENRASGKPRLQVLPVRPELLDEPIAIVHAPSPASFFSFPSIRRIKRSHCDGSTKKFSEKGKQPTTDVRRCPDKSIIGDDCCEHKTDVPLAAS